jgi:hypothetical protein
MISFLNIAYFIITLGSFVFSLRSDDFCYRKEMTCEGKYDRNIYTTICKPINCSHHNLGYACNSEYCSVDRSACEEFENINFAYRISSKNKPFSRKKLIKLKKFHQNIKVCPKTYFILDSNEICMNENDCFLEQIVRMRSGNVKLINRIECPCMNKTGYKCGKFHCSVNNHVCDAFESGAFNSSYIRSCANGNTIFEKISSLFN